MLVSLGVREGNNGMKFDEKYHEAEFSDSPERNMFKSDTEEHCFVCGDKTKWFQLDFATVICSDECLETLFVEYEKAERGESR